MPATTERNKAFMRRLFTGNSERHGLTVSITQPPIPDDLGDINLSNHPVRDWAPWYRERYEAQIRGLEAFDADIVPFVGCGGNTGMFAAAFGCPPLADSRSFGAA